MATMTISLPNQIAKRVDIETQRQGFATRSEFIRNLLRRYFGSNEIVFEEFQPKPLDEIRAEFEKTGRYNKKFIDNLIKGLAESSLYADKTTK